MPLGENLLAWAARKTYQLLLTKAPPTRAGVLFRRYLEAFRSRVSKRLDPIIKLDVDGVPLWLPFSHELPLILLRFPLYARNVCAIAHEMESKYRDLHIIDVGANVGDTLALLRKTVHAPVLCIEGDERYYSLLSLNARQFRDVTLAQEFIGEHAVEFRGACVSSKGTAQLVCGDTGILKQRPLTEILKDFPDFATPKFLKIDTDGYDYFVIRGAQELLRSTHPVVFFEYDPRFFGERHGAYLELFPIFQKCGYESLIAYRNTGEYEAMMPLADSEGLEALHQRVISSAVTYYDLAVFHAEDADLCRSISHAQCKP